MLVEHLPPSPRPLYPDGELTDEPEAVMIAELVREAALEGVRDELPHSWRSSSTRSCRARAAARASRCSTCASTCSSSATARRRSSSARVAPGCARSAPTRARGIEALLGQRVYLDLHVKVAKDWQRDPKQLGRLGF